MRTATQACPDWDNPETSPVGPTSPGLDTNSLHAVLQRPQALFAGPPAGLRRRPRRLPGCHSFVPGPRPRVQSAAACRPDLRHPRRPSRRRAERLAHQRHGACGRPVRCAGLRDPAVRQLRGVLVRRDPRRRRADRARSRARRRVVQLHPGQRDAWPPGFDRHRLRAEATAALARRRHRLRRRPRLRPGGQAEHVQRNRVCRECVLARADAGRAHGPRSDAVVVALQVALGAHSRATCGARNRPRGQRSAPRDGLAVGDPT